MYGRHISAYALFFAFLLLAGCGGAGSREEPAQGEAGKYQVVCTIYPQYDWVREILGDQADRWELSLLVQNKLDLHNYQPTVEDMVKISGCDLFIYVGGESDRWADNALRNPINPARVSLHLLDELGAAAKVEEIIEGMEEDEDDGDEEFDEHVWLSLKNAQTYCPLIFEALASLDREYAEAYRRNLSAYMEKLAALDRSYALVLGASPKDTLLFGDRFPFRYLLDDYGLQYYAAFPGCSAETEASFATIVFLADRMDALDLDAVMVTESSDQMIAKTIIANTAGKHQSIYSLNAMQSVTMEEIREGMSYLSIMEGNLRVLEEALR